MPVTEVFGQSSPFTPMLSYIQNSIDDLYIRYFYVTPLYRQQVFDNFKLRFFASLREALGCAELQLPTPEKDATISTLLQTVLQQHPQWRKQLTAPNLLISRNQEIAKATTPVYAGDEIAIFPPVTGG